MREANTNVVIGENQHLWPWPYTNTSINKFSHVHNKEQIAKWNFCAQLPWNEPLTPRLLGSIWIWHLTIMPSISCYVTWQVRKVKDRPKVAKLWPCDMSVIFLLSCVLLWNNAIKAFMYGSCKIQLTKYLINSYMYVLHELESTLIDT